MVDITAVAEQSSPLQCLFNETKKEIMKLPKFRFLPLILTAFTMLAFVPLKAAEIPEPESEKQYFRDREFQIDTFYATTTPDFEQETGSAGIVLTAFLTRNFGLSVSTALENMNGTFLDNISLRGIYRVPVEQTALYAYGGSTRLLKREEWTIDLGVGVEHRFSPNVGPFAEIGMVKLMKHAAEATARVGLRLSF